MRKIHLLALTSLLVAAPAVAQQSWDTELGIQGGFSRFQLTGQGKAARFDLYSIPSAMYVNTYPTAPAVYAIFPVSEKLALEPGLSFIQTAGVPAGGFLPTVAAVSLRGDYALTNSIYGALGVYTRYAGGTVGGSYAHFQFGLEAAAGYRLRLGSRLNGRIEVQAVTVKKQDTNQPFNEYSLLFGLSTPLSESRGTSARRGAAPMAPSGAWRPSFGLSAGYSDIHLDGGPDITVVSFPGSGSTSVAGIIGAPSAPSIFGIFPLNGRWALEVGLDAENLRLGNGTIASFQLAPRADLAFGNHWYGALGPNVHFVRSTGKLEGQSGIGAAWGYRFHLSGALDGRFEASYGVNAKRRSSFGVGVPSTVFGLNFGMMMPLK